MTRVRNRHVVKNQLSLGIVHRCHVIPVTVQVIEGQCVVITIDSDRLRISCSYRFRIFCAAPCCDIERNISQQVNHDILWISLLGCVESCLKCLILHAVEHSNEIFVGHTMRCLNIVIHVLLAVVTLSDKSFIVGSVNKRAVLTAGEDDFTVTSILIYKFTDIPSALHVDVA